MSLKVTCYSALFFTALFSLFSLVFYFGDWQRLAFVAFVGFFVGVMLAPEFEPKKFKRAWLLQILAGAIAGLILGVVGGYSIGLLICCAFIGAFIGWLAPSWLKYVQIP